MNNSKEIIKDNIRILMTQTGFNSYEKLSKATKVNVNTIKSWFGKSKTVYPKLNTLDTFCNALNIKTSDLFILNKEFIFYKNIQNNSRKQFIKNFNELMIKKALSRSDIEEILSSKIYPPTLYSYLRKKNGRTIPIDVIDEICNLLEIEPYTLLKH